MPAVIALTFEIVLDIFRFVATFWATSNSTWSIRSSLSVFFQLDTVSTRVWSDFGQSRAISAKFGRFRAKLAQDGFFCRTWPNSLDLGPTSTTAGLISITCWRFRPSFARGLPHLDGIRRNLRDLLCQNRANFRRYGHVEHLNPRQ